MRTQLLSPREGVVWALCFIIVATLLVLTKFTSADPDSALYASISGRLTQEPVARWIAPEWWGFWPETNMTGLFREHPSGVFVVPAAVSRLGIPGEQAAYVVGVGLGLIALLLIGVIVAQLASPSDGRAAIVLLQIMPVAFLFRIRANHEYPMLVALLLTIVSLEGARRSSWWWVLGVACGLTYGLLVKGVFVVLVLLAAGLWIVINPGRGSGSIVRMILASLIGAAVTIGVAWLYDVAYLHVTGERFWGPYWQRQLGPVTIASPLDNASTLAGHLAFYLSRLLWFPAPWSLVLIWTAWRKRGRLSSTWRAWPTSVRRGLTFALAFASIAVFLLSPSSRFAERYAFSAAFMIGAAGSVVAYRAWPRLRGLLDRLDARIPALPALVWLILMLLRLGLGPYLPRIA